MEPTLPTLADPPTATSIAAEKTTLVELTAEERDMYKLLYQTWKDNNLRISTQLEALGKIQDYIINNISTDNIKII
jgi:DNA replication initiation complex subunit (GINS family)